MSFTPVQLEGFFMALKGQCVSCLKPTHYLWTAAGFPLTDESTSDGFCHACWNY
jgi:hypothetical protein